MARQVRNVGRGYIAVLIRAQKVVRDVSSSYVLSEVVFGLETGSFARLPMALPQLLIVLEVSPELWLQRALTGPLKQA